MKLALYVNYDESEDKCLEDPRLSRRSWIIGPVAITVGPHTQLGNKTSLFIADSEPYMNIHGGVNRYSFTSDSFDPAAFETALKEAREYAVEMSKAVKEHIARLSHEYIVK